MSKLSILIWKPSWNRSAPLQNHGDATKLNEVGNKSQTFKHKPKKLLAVLVSLNLIVLKTFKANSDTK